MVSNAPRYLLLIAALSGCALFLVVRNKLSAWACLLVSVCVFSVRSFRELAEEVILLLDSSKFQGSGNVVCVLEEVDVVFAGNGISKRDQAMPKDAVLK